MVGDEYSVGGGKLKLKGSKVSGGRVEKKKKKSTKKKEGEASQSKAESDPGVERPEKEKDEGVRSEEDKEYQGDAPGKTEAEKRAEEVRRKRVCSSHSLICLENKRKDTNSGLFFASALLYRLELTFRDSCMSGFSAKVSKLIRSVWKS